MPNIQGGKERVLDLRDVEYIKKLYEEDGVSLREIAKRTKHDFRTVRKYAYCNDWSPPVKLAVISDTYPVLGPYIPIIDEWLESDKKEPRGQRHTIKRVFDRLKKEHSYKGSYSTVKRYVNLKKEMGKKVKEGYLPIAQPPAHAQADFGEFKYYDGAGHPHKGHYLVVSFPYSNSGWIQVFPAENQECLLTGLQRIFRHIGGCPALIRFDNMSTAVVEVLKAGERILTEGFRRFKLHYRFDAVFCNPGKGNEKGNVECKVGYSRRNMLVPVPMITCFDEFNAELLSLCDTDGQREHYKKEKLHSELWHEERAKLLTLPQNEYDVFRYESLVVNSYGFVVIDTVKYGLSPEMSGIIVQAKIYFDKVEVYHDKNLLKTFVRSYKRNDEVYDWRIYLPSLSKKPGAIPYTRFFNQMPKLWQGHLQSLNNRGRKSALMVLSEIISDGNDDLCDDALELAADAGRTDADSIRQCYYLISKQEHHPKPLDFVSNPPKSGYEPNLIVYDELYGNHGKGDNHGKGGDE
jgi:transposase